MFDVIDLKTGKFADIEHIVKTEKWASHLLWMDIDGWYLGEDGSLILKDDCENVAYADTNRFRVVGLETSEQSFITEVTTKDVFGVAHWLTECARCGYQITDESYRYCPHCGAKFVEGKIDG